MTAPLSALKLPSALRAGGTSIRSSSGAGALTSGSNPNLVSILDRPLVRSKGSQEISLNAFAFLFSEVVQYAQKRVSGIPDLERKLGEVGYGVGVRIAELFPWRERTLKRETKLLPLLMYIHTTVWSKLFGKPADALERGSDHADEYMISDNEPLVNRFLSVPKDLQQLNCGAFMAGIVEALLEGSQFPSRVTAHSTPLPGFPQRTTILIKLDPAVMERELQQQQVLGGSEGR